MEQTENPWKKYKRNRNCFIVLLVLAPCILMISGYTEKSFGAFPSTISTIWFLLIIYYSISLSNFRCPRCGKPFIYNDKKGIESRINGFTRKCLNCKLPKWSLPDDSNME
jgi:predicted RNA-binding Zn-ribbon protein involved in translation (DUF1610 family)